MNPMNAVNRSHSLFSKPGPEKAITMAPTLAEAEKAILAITLGQVDAILGSEGHAYLLRPAWEDLRQEERRLQAVLDSAADAISVVNRAGVILSQSHGVNRVLGYEPESLVGRMIFEFVHDEDLSAVYFAFFEVIEGFRENATVRFLHRIPNGSYRMIEAAVGKLRDAATANVVFCLRPVCNPTARIGNGGHGPHLESQPQTTGKLL